MRAALLVVAGCAEDLLARDPLPVEALDEAFFRCRVPERDSVVLDQGWCRIRPD